jgi:hypothetical protein
MLATFPRPILAVLGLAAILAGCSSGAVIDHLPSDMGLPAGAPARPADPYLYPAVHDMPPPRATSPMSEEEQLKAEQELAAVRDRQEAAEGTKAAPVTKKKPAESKNAETSGAKADTKAGAKTNP